MTRLHPSLSSSDGLGDRSCFFTEEKQQSRTTPVRVFSLASQYDFLPRRAVLSSSPSFPSKIISSSSSSFLLLLLLLLFLLLLLRRRRRPSPDVILCG